MKISTAINKKKDYADRLMQCAPNGFGINRDNVLSIAQELVEYSKVLIEIDRELSKNDKSGAMDGL